MARKYPEEMYTLSYEEARAKYGTGVGNNVYFMSKEQFDLEKAKIEAKKKAAANEGEAENANNALTDSVSAAVTPNRDENSMAEKYYPEEMYLLPYEQARAKYGTGVGNNVYFMSKDNFEQEKARIEEQKRMAANEGEAEKTVPGSTSAGDGNNALTDSVAEVTTPKENDTPGVVSSKNNYNKAMMSIWDAYRAGEISKETAGYFTIDAIATLAKNLGRSIGNVGAQFSGGTIDNGHDESKWGQRQNALLNETIGKDTESLGGAAGRQAESEELDIAAKKIRNAYTPAQLEQQIEMFKKDLEMADINLDMAHSKTDLINFIKKDPDYAKSPFKMGLVAYLTQAGAAGAANNASKTLGDAINWMLTFIK